MIALKELYARTGGKPLENQPLVQVDGERFIVTGHSSSVTRYQEAAYLNPDLLTKEYERLSTSINLEGKAAFGTDIFGRRQFNLVSRNPREMKILGSTWTSAYQDSIEVSKAANSWTKRYGEMQQNGEADQFRSLQYLLSMFGSSLDTGEHLGKLRSLARDYGSSRAADRFLDLLAFDGVYENTVKFGNLSIEDITKMKKRDGNFYADYISFFDTASKMQVFLDHDRVFNENKKGVAGIFPNVAKKKIEAAASRVNVIRNFSAPQIATGGFSGDRIAREAMRRARNFFIKNDLIKDEMYALLFNPDSSDFSVFQEAVAKLLIDHKYFRINTLFTLFTTDPQKVVNAYRKSQQLKDEGKEPEFYHYLALGIKEFVEEMPAIGNILSADDIPLFMNDPQEKKKDIPVQEIQSKLDLLKHRHFPEPISIDPALISWYGLVEPSDVALRFGKNNTKLDVTLHYTNEFDEEETVAVNVDAKAGTFDWNVIDVPEAFPEIRQIFLHNISSLLDTIPSQKDKQAVGVKPVSLPERTAPHLRIRDKNKTVQSESIGPDDQIQEEIYKRRFRIVLPPEEKLTDMLEKFSPLVRQEIMDDFLAYNETAVGDIVQKVSKNPYFTRRKRDVRTLMTKGAIVDGVQELVIKDIDYHDQIYRRNRLWKKSL